MTYVRIFNKKELKKLYRLLDNIAKDCKEEKYKYIFIGQDGMRGADSYRIGKYSKIVFEKPVAIPLKVVVGIKVINPESMELALIEDKVIQCNLKNKDGVIYSIKLDKPNIPYPAFEKVDYWKKDYIDVFEAKTEDLKIALKEINKVAPRCIFEITTKGVILIGVDEDRKEKKRIEIKPTKATRPFKIMLNPKYMLDYLRKSKDLTVKIRFLNSSSYVWFEESGENYDYILMPIAMVD